MTVVYSDVYRKANRDSAVSLSFMGPCFETNNLCSIHASLKLLENTKPKFLLLFKEVYLSVKPDDKEQLNYRHI